MVDYCSFLIIAPQDANRVAEIKSPDDWTFDLCDDLSGRFWFTSSSCQIIQRPGYLGTQPQGTSLGKLLVIQAKESHIADNAANLVRALYDIIEGSPDKRLGQQTPIPIPDTVDARKSIFQTTGYFEHFAHREDLPIALEAASRAWLSASLRHAIHKLALSYSQDSITWWSTHPKHGQIFDKYSELDRDRVTTAFAINSAFAAIEELQLQVKSSSKNRRFLDNDTGEWNPSVIEDLRSRLVNAGVDPDRKIQWTVRGPSTIAEERISPSLGTLAPYSDGQVVRDTAVNVPEALHYCSFVRNFMTAHRFSDATAFLGPYEVFNIQSIARHLILAACGCWSALCPSEHELPEVPIAQ
jgi:hypothetical protein